ncbi:MAG TPA: DoxX family protein [Lacunisphaera sp.]|nr:DoxX family protein [Lacunisphaera sp.]
MNTHPSSSPAFPSRAASWSGRVLTTLCVLFLLMDAVMKFVKPEPVIKGTLDLGYPESSLPIMGISLLAGLLLHVIPRTALLGALVITGYLGGAVATHVRVDNPLFSHVLFPTYIAAMLWGGLALRRPQVSALLLGTQSGNSQS